LLDEEEENSFASHVKKITLELKFCEGNVVGKKCGRSWTNVSFVFVRPCENTIPSHLGKQLKNICRYYECRFFR
jgi:hypothetical protein